MEHKRFQTFTLRFSLTILIILGLLWVINDLFLQNMLLLFVIALGVSAVMLVYIVHFVSMMISLILGTSGSTVEEDRTSEGKGGF